MVYESEGSESTSASCPGKDDEREETSSSTWASQVGKSMQVNLDVPRSGDSSEVLQGGPRSLISSSEIGDGDTADARSVSVGE